MITDHWEQLTILERISFHITSGWFIPCDKSKCISNLTNQYCAFDSMIMFTIIVAIALFILLIHLMITINSSLLKIVLKFQIAALLLIKNKTQL